LGYTFNIMLKLTDPEGFAAAYRQHERSVYGAALRVLGDPTRAEDVVQDVFLRLWRRPEAFDPARGELGSFLRLMARSRALDLWRENDAASRARDRLELAAVASEPLRRDDGPVASLEREEDRTVIRAAVAELPEAQREAVALAYWGGLTAQEISRRVSVPLGTAKSRLRLGLGKLRTECAGTV
jgi:RNA polymerase sigma-70 factor, ECF subfamily